MHDRSGLRTLVVGGSRGLGRGVAIAFHEAGADVVVVARSAEPLAALAAAHPGIGTEIADATDDGSATRLIDRCRPNVLILAAGATPVMAQLQNLGWDAFSTNWHSDVKIAFTWLRAALSAPLPPGSRIVVFGSGAALDGSPLSGGYAGAKATQRFLAEYGQQWSDRDGLRITVTTVMPRMTPHGDVGRAGIRAYARLRGQSEEEFVENSGALLTRQIAGSAVVDLVRTDSSALARAYLLTAGGCAPVG
ncbi:SDR family oxidoreductase [Mycolicibacterium obuense]|uniref:Short chain dehydrogenase n=1 Tax=Mycolicibacterium obuense TaxID=1807 RepID=A0A0J6YZV2_9MYCO|nr:SDR family oxidoreductase [Mycolicibacterium obuense]KMO77906.1 short chain dehydrogenase [Mycolicibacterium obuense]